MSAVVIPLAVVAVLCFVPAIGYLFGLGWAASQDDYLARKRRRRFL